MIRLGCRDFCHNLLIGAHALGGSSDTHQVMKVVIIFAPLLCRSPHHQVNVTSLEGGTSHTWIVTFISISGDVGDLIVDDTSLTTGSVVVAERVKVR